MASVGSANECSSAGHTVRSANTGMKTGKTAEAKKESGKSSPKTDKPGSGSKKKPVGLLKKLADAKEVGVWHRDFFPWC